MKALAPVLALVLSLVSVVALPTQARAEDEPAPVAEITASPTLPAGSEDLPTFTVRPTGNANETRRIRAIMRKIERNGGGTIVFTSGVYRFANSVYVPSNTTVYLEKGATIRKSKKAALKGNPSDSIFQTLRESRYKKTKIYGGYEGETNITFTGEGTIDLAGIKGADGIIAAHTTDLTVRGLTFKNVNQGHFIELNASSGGRISNNTFKNAKDRSGEKEAINIDTADPKTGSLTVKWSKGDKTPVKDAVISYNTFENLRVGVGTHKYSYGGGSFKYHTGIVVVRNVFEGTSSDAIRALAWKDSLIANNIITAAKGSAVWLAGVDDVTVKTNTMTRLRQPGQAIVVRGKDNTGAGSGYPHLRARLTCDNLEELATNLTDGQHGKARLAQRQQGVSSVALREDVDDEPTGVACG